MARRREGPMSISLRAMCCLMVAVGATVSQVRAEPVTRDQVAKVVLAFAQAEIARSVEDGARGVPKATSVVSLRPFLDQSTGRVLAYVSDLAPQGYIVLSSDTEISPIIAYSYDSSFPWDEDPEGVFVQLLRADMQSRLSAIDHQVVPVPLSEQNKALWQSYSTPAGLSESSSPVYGPWTTTWWAQGSPYSDLCPMDPVTEERSVVGCTATALSQILNYWQFPTSVTFTSDDDYTTATREIPITATTANFAGLDYNACSPSDADKAALCFAAGVSLRMDYTSEGSGAQVSYVPPALSGGWCAWPEAPPERWNYTSADCRSFQESDSWWGAPYYTSEASFYEQLSQDMKLARPAEMSIEDTSGSRHAIVVDGWKGEQWYHLNYGWGTAGWGWYNLPSGMPSGYSIVDKCVLNIVPTTATCTLTVETSGNGSVDWLPDQITLTRGTHVVLEAVPGSGASFAGWSSDLTGTQNPALLILDTDKTVVASFTDSVPAGGKIAFQSDRSGNEEVYVINSDGTGLTNLTNHAATDRSPAWSPDGSKIAFTSDRGPWGVYMMDDNGMDQVAMNDDVANCTTWGIDWSPDGSHVVFVSCASGDNEIYVMAADGSGLKNLTNDPTWDEDPAWSPDGSRIAFASYQDETFNVYLINPDGSGRVQLTGKQGWSWDTEPAWSPDGSRIAFTSWIDSNYEICVMNADGTGISRLTNNPSADGQPTWSPDGTKIAFVSDRGGNHDIYVMASDGTAVTDVTNSPGADEEPDWRPSAEFASTPAVLRIARGGDVFADGSFFGQSFQSGSADVAEWAPVSESVEAGDVLELDPQNPGHYRKARARWSALVAGVVSTAPGFILGNNSPPATDQGQRALLALVGIVPVKVTDEGGSIEVGDLLAVSSTPGMAMRRMSASGGNSGLVGKALEPLTGATGVISVLLMR